MVLESNGGRASLSAGKLCSKERFVVYDDAQEKCLLPGEEFEPF